MLSYEKILELANKMPRGFMWYEGCEWESGITEQEAIDFAKAIEAAVLAEQSKRIEELESAIDEQMVSACLGVFHPEDDPRTAIKLLMDWSQGVGEYFAREKLLEEQANAEPVAYGLFWKIDGKEVLQFPVCATEEEAKGDLRMYSKDDQAAMTIRPLYLHPAPAPEGMAMVQMVDAAMAEMQNIHPPLRRSECERLIRAAMIATAEKEPKP